MPETQRSYSIANKNRWIGNDPLNLIETIIGSRLRKHVLTTQIILMLNAFYLEVFNAIYLVQAMKEPCYIHQYITSFLLQQPDCIGLLILAYNLKTLLNWRGLILINCWSSDACGPTVERKILRESKMGNYFCIFVAVHCFFTHVTFCPIVGDEASVLYTIMFIEKYCGKWGSVLKFFTYLSTVISFVGLTILFCYCLYICLHLQFQLKLLTEYVMQIADDVEDPDQDAIFKKLSTCIAHHVRMKRLANVFMKVPNMIILVIYITGTLGGLSGFYFIITNISPKSNFRIINAAIVASIVVFASCYYGQHLIDESNNFSSAIASTPWVHWNQKNKRALLLLYMNSSKPFTLSCCGVVDMNYSYLLSFTRMVYSLSAVIMKIK